MSVTPRDFRSKPLHVEAMQFDGWGSAIAISEWLNGAGGASVFFVPPGYEHPHRRSFEQDTGDGSIKDTAVGFLVFQTGGGQVRVNPSCWVVRKPDGSFSVWDNTDFNTEFEVGAGPA